VARAGEVTGRRPGPRAAAREDAGVTLIELVIIVVIIAIIAAISVALYQDIVKKSKLAADESIVGSLRSAVAIYYANTNGLFPADLASVEALVTPAPVFNCSVPPDYDPSNGKLTLTASLSDCP
jgi:type II secretory pathway pseudopilin PulG